MHHIVKKGRAPASRTPSTARTHKIHNAMEPLACFVDLEAAAAAAAARAVLSHSAQQGKAAAAAAVALTRALRARQNNLAGHS